MLWGVGGRHIANGVHRNQARSAKCHITSLPLSSRPALLAFGAPIETIYPPAWERATENVSKDLLMLPLVLYEWLMKAATAPRHPEEILGRNTRNARGSFLIPSAFWLRQTGKEARVRHDHGGSGMRWPQEGGFKKPEAHNLRWFSLWMNCFENAL